MPTAVGCQQRPLPHSEGHDRNVTWVSNLLRMFNLFCANDFRLLLREGETSRADIEPFNCVNDQIKSANA